MWQGRGFLGRRNRERIRRIGGCLFGVILFGPGLLWALLYGQAAAPTAKESSKEVALQVIVVSTPELANQVLERLKAGSDFATLAKEKSIDPTADSGGFTGRMDLAALRPKLREFDLAQGSLFHLALSLLGLRVTTSGARMWECSKGHC
jgi:PPIC-type PPIASE domain